MDRMKLWLLPMYATAGFLAIVLLAPSSRWVVRTQLDVVQGYWKYNAGPNYGELNQIYHVYPIERGLNEDDPAPDKTARFLRLVTPSKDSKGDSEYIQRFKSLFELCSDQNDARYWAQFIRVAAYQAQIRYTPPGQKPFPHRDIRPVQELLRDACRAGGGLDPKNAFFSMILAGTLNRLGDFKGSREAFLRAGASANYDDYAAFEPELRIKYLADHYGDRGHQVTAMIVAQTILPHLSGLYATGRYFTQPNDLPGRLATLRLGALIMEKDRSAIGVIVARRLVAWALDPGTRESLNPAFPKARVAELVKKMQAEAGGDFGIAHGADVYNSIPPEAKNWPPSPDSIRLLINLRPALSAWSLWSLCLLPLALGFLYLRSPRPRFSGAAPYLIWLMALSTEHAFGSGYNAATPFGLLSLLFIPAMFPKVRKYVDWFAIIFLLLAWFVSLGCYPLGIPTVLFTVSLVATRRFDQPLLAVTWIGTLVACVVGAAYWICVATQHGFGDSIVFGTLAMIGAFASIPARRELRWSILAGACCLVLGAWFGVMVSRDLAADQVMRVMSERFLNDADELRSGNR